MYLAVCRLLKDHHKRRATLGATPIEDRREEAKTEGGRRAKNTARSLQPARIPQRRSSRGRRCRCNCHREGRVFRGGGVGNRRQSQPASPSILTPKCFTMISQHGRRAPRSRPEPSREGLLSRPPCAAAHTVDHSPPASHPTPPHHHARGARSGSPGGGGSVAVAVAVLCHTKRLFLDVVAPKRGYLWGGGREGGGAAPKFPADSGPGTSPPSPNRPLPSFPVPLPMLDGHEQGFITPPSRPQAHGTARARGDAAAGGSRRKARLAWESDGLKS
jgi:hypothetical protein